jgi:hypothetical protein
MALDPIRKLRKRVLEGKDLQDDAEMTVAEVVGLLDLAAAVAMAVKNPQTQKFSVLLTALNKLWVQLESKPQGLADGESAE